MSLGTEFCTKIRETGKDVLRDTSSINKLKCNIGAYIKLIELAISLMRDDYFKLIELVISLKHDDYFKLIELAISLKRDDYFKPIEFAISLKRDD
ncbi:hypothetical protein GJ496_002931 [Pomphorhynchus laevis]|nr:hypothetical protein GJ496_002931 [Pomphorhynchus laevis]